MTSISVVGVIVICISLGSFTPPPVTYTSISPSNANLPNEPVGVVAVPSSKKTANFCCPVKALIVL